MLGKNIKRIGMAVLIISAVAGSLLFLGVEFPIGKTDARKIVEVPAPAPSVVELASVEVTIVEPMGLTDLVRVSGELRPLSRAVLRAKVGGVIKEVNARIGQVVRAGDILVRIDDDDLASVVVQVESSLEAMRAQLVLAEQSLAKTEELARKGFASRSVLEKATSEVVALRANMEGLAAQASTARSALGDAVIAAPFDGVIASRAAEIGETTVSGTELVSVVDVSALEAEVLVSTRDVGRIEIGQEVEIQIDGFPGKTVIGEVDRISPVANEGSRFVPVHVRLDNADGRLWGGMFATGSIKAREAASAITVPIVALRESGDGPYVLKIMDGIFVRQNVVIGPKWENGNLVEISAGLSLGDVVLSAPLPGMEAGMLVSVSGS